MLHMEEVRCTNCGYRGNIVPPHVSLCKCRACITLFQKTSYVQQKSDNIMVELSLLEINSLDNCISFCNKIIMKTNNITALKDEKLIPEAGKPEEIITTIKKLVDRNKFEFYSENDNNEIKITLSSLFYDFRKLRTKIIFDIELLKNKKNVTLNDYYNLIVGINSMTVKILKSNFEIFTPPTEKENRGSRKNFDDIFDFEKHAIDENYDLKNKKVLVIDTKDLRIKLVKRPMYKYKDVLIRKAIVDVGIKDGR